MKKIRFTGLCLVIIFLTACATDKKSIVKPDITLSAAQQRNALLGKWVGEKKSDKGELQKWLVERYVDGTYKIVFRIYKNETNYKQQTEVGQWGVSGPIYFSILRGWIKEGNYIPANPEDPYHYDAYRIISLKENSFEYETIEPNIRFKVNKVPSDFNFPN